MQGFDHRQYVPVLWTKRGERGALTDLSPQARSACRPLLVVPPIEVNVDTGIPKKSIDAHVKSLPKDLVDSWGVGEAFLDASYVGDGPLANGQHPLDWLSQQAASLGLILTAAVSPSSSAAYMNAAMLAAGRSGDVCLRLPFGAWPSAASVSALLATLGMKAADAHLVLDMRDQVHQGMDLAVQAELASLPYLAAWRSVAVVGAGMPETFPPGQGLKSIPRREWAIHQSLVAASLPRVPTFGDYAVASVSPGPLVDPRFLNISARLRYTVASEWLVAQGALYKGNKGRGIGGRAVPPVAKLLVGSAQFSGASHCGTEAWLTAAATGRGAMGNPEAWRKWGTLHHLEFATTQTAAIP